MSKISTLLELFEKESPINPDLYELQKYRKLGTVEEVHQALLKSMELIAKYKQLGTPEEISQVIDQAEKLWEKYNELIKKHPQHAIYSPEFKPELILEAAGKRKIRLE